MEYRIERSVFPSQPLYRFAALLFAVVLLMSLQACGVSEQGNPAQASDNDKPGIPLSLEIIPEGTPAPGETASFQVLAHSSVALEEMVLTVKLSGLTLIDGALESRGPVQANGVLSVKFTVEVPDQGRRVITATAETNHLGARFAMRSQYVVGDHGPDGSANRKSQPHDTDGVIEYELP